jgi:hypothetical protein
MMRRDRAGDPIDPYVPADEGPEVPAQPARPAMAAKHGPPVARVYGTDVVPGRLVYLRASEGYLEKFKDYGTGWQSAKCAAGHVVIAFAEAVDGVTYEVVQFWRGKNKYLPGQAWIGGGYTHAWADSRLVSHEVDGYADGEVSYVLTKNAGGWSGFDGDAAGMTMRGLCQMRALWMTLPDSRIGDFKYELRGQFAGGAPQPDADPADVVKDLIAIADPGRSVEVDIGPGGTAASGFRTYCAANGFRVSRGIDVATVDIELVEDLLAACDSMLVWSDGKWKAVPLGDRATGSYVPPATAVALNEDEWLRDGTDSPTLRVERIPADQIFDCYPIRIHERAAAYEVATYEYIDPVAGSGPGELVRADPMQSDWVKTAGHALRLSAILATRAKRVRNRFRGRLPARWAILDPGDIVSITHEPLDLTNALARIRRVEVQEDGAVEVEVEEWPTGTAVTVDLTPATHDGLTQAPIPPARSDAALAAAATAVTALLTNESHVAPAAADGSSPDLAGATTEMQVLVGGLDDSANWTFAKVDGLGVVATLVGPVLTITGLTVDASYVDITASHPDLAPVTRRFTIAKARAGATGLQGEQGMPGAAAPLVRLAATAQAFTFDGAGALSPASQTITFTVTRTNITEAAAVTCTRYDAAGTSLGAVTLGGSGDTRTLTSAQFGAAARAVVVATAGGQTDRMTVVRLRDGAAGTPGATGAPGADGADGENAVVGYLTNEAVTVAADAAGVVGGGFGSAGGTFKVFDGLAEKTGSGVAYSVVSETGVDVSIGAATGVYSVASMSADTGTAVLRAIYAGVTIEKTFTIAKSKAGPQGPQGQAGAAGDSVDIIFQRASSQPATPAASAGVPAGWSSSVASAPGTGLLWSCVGTKAGSASTYTWETPARIEGQDGAAGSAGAAGLSVAELTIYRRAASAPAAPTGGSYAFGTLTLTPPASWSVGIPAGSDPVYTSRAVASVQGTTGTDSTLTWSSPVLSLQNGAQGPQGEQGPQGPTGQTGPQGTRGSVEASIQRSSASWLNAEAVTAITALTGSATLVAGDRVTQYYPAGNWTETRFWNGSGWVVLSVLIDGNMLVTGSVGADALAAQIALIEKRLKVGYTFNGSEGTSTEVPTGGVKLEGTTGALGQILVGPNGMRIGNVEGTRATKLGSVAARAISALGASGDAESDRTWYVGNASSVNSGKPVLMDRAWAADSAYVAGDRALYSGNVYRCTLARSPTASPPSSDASHWALVGTMASQERIRISNFGTAAVVAGAWRSFRFLVELQPRAITDNLDGLRNISLVPHTAGSPSAWIDHWAFPMEDRLYADKANDGAAANSWFFTFQRIFDGPVGGSSYFDGFFQVILRNHAGATERVYRSVQLDNGFGVYTGGVALNGQPPPTPPPDGDPGTGTCPAPETLVTMANAAHAGPGELRPAGDVLPDEWVWTRHEITGRWGAYRVIGHSLHWSERVRTRFADGRAIVSSPPHRMAVDSDYRAVTTFRPGTLVDGSQPGSVLGVEPCDPGPVVKMTIEDAHTYETEGLLSHNAKPRNP